MSYPIKDFEGSLVPSPFPKMDLSELTSERSKSIVNMTRDETERSAMMPVESGDPVLDGYRW